MNHIECYSEELVRKVNELYHDFTGHEYQVIHDEIFQLEQERWRRLAKQFIDFEEVKRIIDIGSGTGFVPITIGDLVNNDTEFFCIDVSDEMLRISERNIQDKKLQCCFRFERIGRGSFRLPVESGSVDVVTMNSVLHHIKDTDCFFCEIDRVIRPGGYFLIGHEPNKYFYQHKILRFNHSVINFIMNPKVGAKWLFKKLHLYIPINKLYHKSFTKDIIIKQSCVAQKINSELQKEKLIGDLLTYDEIENIVDIKAFEGFKPDACPSNYKLLHIETYNHLARVFTSHPTNFFISKYDEFLRKKYPRSGATYFSVFKKPTSA